MVKKILVIIAIVSALSACNEKLTYSYLMEHPNELKQEVVRCQLMEEKTRDQAARCETVMNAAENIASIMDEQQQDPEKFGQKILDTEFAWVKAQEDMLAARQTLNALKTKNGSLAELKAAQDKLNQVQKAYQDRSEEVKVLLAVAGMNSPE